MVAVARQIEDEPSSAVGLVPTLALGAFVTMVGGLALGPFLPQVADEVGTSVSVVGQVQSAALLLAGALGLVIGPLADRFGYRPALVTGLLAVAISMLGAGLAAALAPLLLAGLVGAVGRAAVLPTALAVVGARFSDEDDRRRAVSWVSTGQSAAPLLGIPVLTTVAAFADWRASMLVLGGVALALALVHLRMPMGGAARTSAPRLRDILVAYAALRHHRPSLALLGGSVVANMGAWATYTYYGAYLAQRHGYDTHAVGLGYLVVGVGTVLGTRLVGSRLGARLRPLMLLARVVSGVLIGAALSVPMPAVAAVALLTVAALAHTVGTVGTAVLLVAESPAGRATTMTVNSAGLSFGTAGGGALGGLALALGDYPVIGLVSLAWLLAAAALVRWTGPCEPRVPTP